MAVTRHQVERTLISDIVNALEKELTKPSRSVERPLLPAIVRAILSVDAAPAKVETAFARLERDFVDWNEVRVTNTRDIAATIRGIGQDSAKAEALKAILSRVFLDRHELYFDFLTDMRDENLIAYLESASGLARVYQQAVLVYALGHPSLLVSEGTVRALKRVGVLPKQMDVEAATEALSGVVPKRRLLSLSVLMGHVAVNFCSVRKPSCSICPLRVLCNSAKTLYGKRRKTTGV